jgi:protein-arginine kinase
LRRQSLHDAAGINDDYPVGRGIFIEDQFEFFVLVNLEDHIQIIVAPENTHENGFGKALAKLIKLNLTFEKIGFATDSYLGFLSVSPENLGTGLSL